MTLFCIAKGPPLVAPSCSCLSHWPSMRRYPREGRDERPVYPRKCHAVLHFIPSLMWSYGNRDYAMYLSVTPRRATWLSADMRPLIQGLPSLHTPAQVPPKQHQQAVHL